MRKTPFRDHVRRDGSPKRQFMSQAAADQFIIETKASAHSYKCSLCFRFHIASDRDI